MPSLTVAPTAGRELGASGEDMRAVHTTPNPTPSCSPSLSLSLSMRARELSDFTGVT